MTNVKPIGVAVLGMGNVGREVVRIIEESSTDLAARIGAPLEPVSYTHLTLPTKRIV